MNQKLKTNVQAPTYYRPLTGIRVVDFTVAWAGPLAGRILALLGAEVIHVEGPKRVDSWRDPVNGGYPNRYPDLDPGYRPFDRSSRFNSQNLGKQSVSIDIKHPDGAQLLRDLVLASDVLLTNFRPGTLDRLGIGWDKVKSERPDIIVVEMPAYGLDGPRAQEGGYGPTMEASCGMAAMVGYGDGRPYTTGPAYLDAMGGFNGAAAVLTAVLGRSRTGQGAHLEMAQCETAMQSVGEVLLEAVDRGRSRKPQGNSVEYAEPHEAFPTAGEDAWVAVNVSTDDAWVSFCNALGLNELATDSRFDDALKRRHNRAELYELISQVTKTLDKEQVATRLQAVGVAAAPVCNGHDAAIRADLWQAEYFQRIDVPGAGSRLHQGLPLRYGGHLLPAPGPAPQFGADNHRVVVEVLGRSESQYEGYVADKVVTDVPAGYKPKASQESATPAKSEATNE